jgi:hypothetical protein
MIMTIPTQFAHVLIGQCVILLTDEYGQSLTSSTIPHMGKLLRIIRARP